MVNVGKLPNGFLFMLQGEKDTYLTTNQNSKHRVGFRVCVSLTNGELVEINSSKLACRAPFVFVPQGSWKCTPIMSEDI